MYSRLVFLSKNNTELLKSEVTKIIMFSKECHLEKNKSNLLGQDYFHKVVRVEQIKKRLEDELANSSGKELKNLETSLIILNQKVLEFLIRNDYLIRQEDIVEFLAVFPESLAHSSLHSMYKSLYEQIIPTYDDNFTVSYMEKLNLKYATVINKQHYLGNVSQENVKKLVAVVEKNIGGMSENLEDKFNFILGLNPELLDEVLKSKKVIHFLLDSEVMNFKGVTFEYFRNSDFYQHLFLHNSKNVIDVYSKLNEDTVVSMFNLMYQLEKSYLSGASADGLLGLKDSMDTILSIPSNKELFQEIIENSIRKDLNEIMGKISLGGLYLVKKHAPEIYQEMVGGVFGQVDDWENIDYFNEIGVEITKENANQLMLFTLSSALLVESARVEHDALKFYSDEFRHELDMSFNFNMLEVFYKREVSISSYLLQRKSDANSQAEIVLENKNIVDTPMSDERLFADVVSSSIHKDKNINKLAVFSMGYPIFNKEDISKHDKSVLDLFYFFQRMEKIKELYGCELDFEDVVKRCVPLLKEISPEHLELLKQQEDVYNNWLNNIKSSKHNLLPLFISKEWDKSELDKLLPVLSIKIEEMLMDYLVPQSPEKVVKTVNKF